MNFTEAKTTIVVAVITSVVGGLVGNVLPSLLNYEADANKHALAELETRAEQLQNTVSQLEEGVRRQREGRQSCVSEIELHLANARP